MILKSLILSMFFALSTYVVAEEASTSYSGIWQDPNQSNAYYIIQERDDELVLLALPGIEASGDTLSYSYIGNKEDLLLTRLSSEASFESIYDVVRVNFTSDNTASIMSTCDVCNAVPIDLVKIF